MKNVKWLAFFVVVIIGGGLNIPRLGALDPNADKNKMEEAKSELLSDAITILNIQDCEISIKALKLLYEEREDITLKLSAKNPTDKEIKLILPLRVDTTTSSIMMRMVPMPVTILRKDIIVTIPSGKIENKDIVLSQKSRDSSDTTEINTNQQKQKQLKMIDNVLDSVTVYSIYATITDADNKGRDSLMCSFGINNPIEKIEVPKKPQEVTVLKK